MSVGLKMEGDHWITGANGGSIFLRKGAMNDFPMRVRSLFFIDGEVMTKEFDRATYAAAVQRMQSDEMRAVLLINGDAVDPYDTIGRLRELLLDNQDPGVEVWPYISQQCAELAKLEELSFSQLRKILEDQGHRSSMDSCEYLKSEQDGIHVLRSAVKMLVAADEMSVVDYVNSVDDGACQHRMTQEDWGVVNRLDLDPMIALIEEASFAVSDADDEDAVRAQLADLIQGGDVDMENARSALDNQRAAMRPR